MGQGCFNDATGDPVHGHLHGSIKAAGQVFVADHPFKGRVGAVLSGQGSLDIIQGRGVGSVGVLGEEGKAGAFRILSEQQVIHAASEPVQLVPTRQQTAQDRQEEPRSATAVQFVAGVH